MDNWLREHIVCPRDNCELTEMGEELVCSQGHVYPLRDGIPIMLVAEAPPTHGSCITSINGSQAYDKTVGKVDQNSEIATIDPFVQRMVGATCGKLYRPVIGNLTSYPIPDLPLGNADGALFLDIGCGWGRWCLSASEKGYRSIGIDTSLESVLAAKRVSEQMGQNIEYLVADCRYLPFRTESFDLIFSFSVLHHFSKENAISTLMEIDRTLISGGVSLVQMSNVFGLHNIFNQIIHASNKSIFAVRYWTPRELKRSFEILIGPTSVFAQGFFTTNAQMRDIELLPLKYRWVVRISDFLSSLSNRFRPLVVLADSLYIKSVKL